MIKSSNKMPITGIMQDALRYSRSYRKLLSDNVIRAIYISYWSIVLQYLRSYWKLLSEKVMTQGRYISDSCAIQGYIFPHGETHSVNENIISSLWTLQFPLSSTSKKLFFQFTASKGMIFFLKMAYLNLKHLHNMAATYEGSLLPWPQIMVIYVMSDW